MNSYTILFGQNWNRHSRCLPLWPRASSEFQESKFAHKRGQCFNKREIVTVKESASNDSVPLKP